MRRPAVTGLWLGAGVVAAAAAAAYLLAADHPWTLRLDNKLVHFPMTLEAYRRWASGEMPAWSASLWSGYTLLADPTTAGFYLPHLLPFALTPEPHLRAYDLVAALHVGILSAGMACLAATLGTGTGGALLAAALGLLDVQAVYFAASFMPMLTAFAWWPWVLVAAERLVDPARRPGPGLALGSAALAAQVLGGFPELAFYSGVVATLWLLLARGGPPLGRRASRLALLAGMAMLLAGPQLLPTMATISETGRSGDVPYWIAALDHARPWPLAPLFDPRGARGWPRPIFLGLATVLLALLGVARGRRRAIGLAAAASLGWLLALGPWTPLYGWLHALPVFARFRVAAKFLVVTDVALAALAAHGLDRLVRCGRPAPAVLGVALALGAVGEHVWYLAGELALDGEVPRTERPLARLTTALEEDVVPLATEGTAEGPPRRVRIGAPDIAFGNLGMLFRLDLERGGIVALPSARHETLLVASASKPRLELFGVGLFYIPDRTDCPPAFEGWSALRRTHGCVLMPAVVPPRWDVVRAARAVASVEEMVALVERDPGGPVPVVAPPEAVRGGSGVTRLLKYRPGDVTLGVDAAADTLLLARESLRRGWTASVDGTSVPVYPAAGILFAVPVPAGTHVVRLVFRQPGLAPGLLAGVGGLAAVALALAAR